MGRPVYVIFKMSGGAGRGHPAPQLQSERRGDHTTFTRFAAPGPEVARRAVPPGRVPFNPPEG